MLTGLRGLHLFFSCYQLVLRHQCWALVKDKGAPGELEAIVKDLWSLRLPLIQQKFVESQPDVTDTEGDESSGGERKLYGSQPQDGETAGGTDDEDDMPGGQRKTEKSYPSLVDSLALCYMGMMLLRLPVSLGEMYEYVSYSGVSSFIADESSWAKSEELPLVRPLRLIPPEMHWRLSPRWQVILENSVCVPSSVCSSRR